MPRSYAAQRPYGRPIRRPRVRSMGDAMKPAFKTAGMLCLAWTAVSSSISFAELGNNYVHNLPQGGFVQAGEMNAATQIPLAITTIITAVGATAVSLDPAISYCGKNSPHRAIQATIGQQFGEAGQVAFAVNQSTFGAPGVILGAAALDAMMLALENVTGGAWDPNPNGCAYKPGVS